LIPDDVIKVIEAIAATGKDVLVKKEKGKWVVLENCRRLVYKEP